MGTAAIAVKWNGNWKNLLQRLRERGLTWPRAVRRPLVVQQTAAIGNKGTVALLSVEGERVLVALTNGCVQFHRLRRADMRLPIEGTVR